MRHESRGLRFRQRTVRRPTAAQAVKDHPTRETDVLGPHRNWMRFASERDQVITTAVSRLSFLRRPCAVLSAIRAVVVHAFQCVSSRRSPTHVFYESGEGLAPTGTDRNTTAAVVFVPGSPRIGATRDHGFPREISRRLRSAVRRVPRSSLFALIAAARGCLARPQCDLPLLSHRTARTSAHPYGAAVGRSVGDTECHQATEALPGQVNSRLAHMSLFSIHAVTAGKR